MVPFTLHADAQRILHDVSRILPVELRALDASLPVEHGALLRCSEWARSAAGQAAMKRAGIGPEGLRLDTLLRNAELFFEPPATKERSPELDERLNLLRQQQLAAEYANMIQPMRRLQQPGYQVATEKPRDTKREEDLARRQLSAMINVVASMGAVATAAWWASASLGGRDAHTQGLRVFFTLFASIFIGAAETFLYIRFFSRSTSNERPPKRISSKRRRPSKLAKPIAIRGPAVRSGHRDHLRQRAIANRLRRETSSSGKPEVDESKKAR